MPVQSQSAGPGERSPTPALRCGVDLDAGTLITGLLVSGVGYVFFSYGRKMSRPLHVLTGLVLMVYPYFVPSVVLSLAIGALLCGLNYLAVRSGY